MSLAIKLICEKCGNTFSVSKKTAAKHKNNVLCRNCRISVSKLKVSQERKEQIKNKQKQTCLERYGVSCGFNTKVARDNLKKIDWNKRNIKSKETKKNKYNDENFNNRTKAYETMNKKYGMHSSKDQSVEKKRADTCKLKYHGASPISDPIIRKKAENTKIKKYGNKNNINKAKETWTKKYGVDNPMKDKNVVEKALESKHFEILKKRGLIYNNIYFDSSWELAYYIWLKDHNISFEYQPQSPIEYIDEKGINRLYFPDFLVKNRFIEIKGNQFFNEKGEPYNLYKKEYWWNKYNVLIENNIYIMKEDEAFTYVKYVNNKYGKNYLKSFKI